MEHPISGLMETTMQKIREMVDVNTIIGEQIVTQDGVTIIPVSKVTFGFTSGGTDFVSKNVKEPQSPNAFGGAAGAGVNISPVAFLVVKGENVRVLNISPPASSAVDRVIELAPDVIEKIGGMFKKKDREEE